MTFRTNATSYPIDHVTERGADDDTALVLKTETLSHAGLRQRVGRLAAWLACKVPERGARVASWAAKGELTCLMPLAAARAGLVHVPVNPLLKHAQAAHILADSGAKLLIGTPGRLKSLQDGELQPECDAMAEQDVLDAATELGGHLGPSNVAPHALAAILYTSGSTGRPKGVMLSHANLWLGAVSVAHYLGMAPDDVTLAVLPLSFDYGQSQLLSTWYAGGAVVPLNYLLARDVMKACAQHGVTTLAAVPPLWVQLSELQWSKDAVANLRRITNSGGALTTGLVRELRGLFPDARLFPMYGLTEAFRSTYLDPALVDSHPTSIGRAIPFAEVLVINDAGKVTGAGEEGELVHCGPLVAQGYWRDAGRTAELFKPAPKISEHGGMAVWSGDRVSRDMDGLLYFVGRRDAMIKSQGHRISPQEIEDAALATGLVTNATVLGIADKRSGQALHLVVQAEPGAVDPERELPRLLARELPNFMQPQVIHWLEAMPLGPNGKIDRVALMQDLSE